MHASNGTIRKPNNNIKIKQTNKQKNTRTTCARTNLVRKPHQRLDMLRPLL